MRLQKTGEATVFKKPKQREINQLAMKLIVGVMALGIASVTSFVSTNDIPLTSISQAYFSGDFARNIFVGFLFAISTILFSYSGETAVHMVLSRVAALAGIGVAMFRCRCGDREEIIHYVHYASAAVMFIVLAYFCLAFYRHASYKPHRQAHWRAKIYLACFWAMVLAIVAFVINAAWGEELGLDARVPRIVFYGEAIALSAFGVCWLVASRVLPGLTRNDERHRLVGEDPTGVYDPSLLPPPPATGPRSAQCSSRVAGYSARSTSHPHAPGDAYGYARNAYALKVRAMWQSNSSAGCAGMQRLREIAGGTGFVLPAGQ